MRPLRRHPRGLLRVAAPGGECPTPTGPELTGHDSRAVRGEPGDVWQSADPPGACCGRRAGEPPARGAADARGRAAGPSGDTLPTDTRTPRVLYQHSQPPARRPGHGAGSGLGRRHHVSEGGGRLALPGRGDGSLLPARPGLELRVEEGYAVDTQGAQPRRRSSAPPALGSSSTATGGSSMRRTPSTLGWRPWASCRA